MDTSAGLDDRTASALAARQRHLQAEAHAVLAHLDLPAHLGRLGPFEHIGSSASGLLVYRDLDVCVRGTDPTTAEVFEALHPVITHRGIHEVVYRDETGPRSPTGRASDQRHYAVLRYQHRTGHLWKIDITVWINPMARPHLTEVERLKREATGAKRDAILWIKDVWHQRAEYGDTIGGTDIYTAVLDDGVRTPDGFAAYLRRRDDQRRHR
jgi:hypothetical protein